MSAGYQTIGVKDPAVRRALERQALEYNARNLRGLYADMPATAPYGAFYRCDDATAPPAGHGGEVYWYAGEGFGWVQMHTEITGEPPSVLHNSLSDLEGGGGHWYHSDQPIDRADSVTFQHIGLDGTAPDGNYSLWIRKSAAGAARTFIACQNTSGLGSELAGIGLYNAIGNYMNIVMAGAAYTGVTWHQNRGGFSHAGGAGMFFDIMAGDLLFEFGPGHTVTHKATAAQWLFADGTAGAPGLSFLSDPDTGLFRSGPDQLDVLVGGHGLRIVDNGSVTTVSRV